MARRKQNPINDILDTAGAWLGGNRGTVNPQVARVQRDLGTVAKTIDTYGTGGVGQAALRDIGNFKQGGSLPTNVMKTAAVNLAAGAAGAKAAQVARKAVQSGFVAYPVAAARNLVKGEQVIVHGTAKKIRGNMLKGVAGEVDDTTKVVFGWDPKQPYSKDFVPQRARSFATGTAYGKPDLQNSQRNVVIARVKKSQTFPHHGGLENEAVITAGNARITSVIKAPPVNASKAEIASYSKNLANEVRKAGSFLRGADRLSELQQRIELAKYQKSLKKLPKKK